MTNIFFKFWRVSSVVIITAVILFCYTNLPDSIAIGHDDQGYPNRFINKQQFFYWTVGIVFSINILMDLLKGLLLKIDFKGLNSTSAWANEPTALQALITGWFSAFLSFVNTYLIFVILGLNNINSRKGQMLDFNYNWLLIFGVFILMILLFFVPLRLLFSNPTPED
mgnify:CR=1 FL=1